MWRSKIEQRRPCTAAFLWKRLRTRRSKISTDNRPSFGRCYQPWACASKICARHGFFLPLNTVPVNSRQLPVEIVRGEPPREDSNQSLQLLVGGRRHRLVEAAAVNTRHLRAHRTQICGKLATMMNRMI